MLIYCIFRILKSLEFSNTESAGTEADKTKSLETLLLEKNRALQNDTTKLKNSNLELTGKRHWSTAPLDSDSTSHPRLATTRPSHSHCPTTCHYLPSISVSPRYITRLFRSLSYSFFNRLSTANVLADISSQANINILLFFTQHKYNLLIFRFLICIGICNCQLWIYIVW